jgi:hypothetical protein
MDADDAEAWWRAVLHDSRARRTRADHIASDDVDASLRLDRWPGRFVTFRCMTCGAHATYEATDLASVFRGDHNITQLPARLVDCPEKHGRREGACRLRAEGGLHVGQVQRVRRPVQPLLVLAHHPALLGNFSSNRLDAVTGLLHGLSGTFVNDRSRPRSHCPCWSPTYHARALRVDRSSSCSDWSAWQGLLAGKMLGRDKHGTSCIGAAIIIGVIWAFVVFRSFRKRGRTYADVR